MTQQFKDFDYEFHSEVKVEDKLKDFTENRLRTLAEGHRDMIGGAVSIEKPAHGETSHIYEASIVAYVKSKNIAAVEKADTVEKALKGALNALERQVREHRDKIGKPWQNPSLK